MHHDGDAGPGEQAFLERLRSRLPPAPPGEVWIGDDAAVLADGLLLATDALVEGVHFDLGWCSVEDAGWKALVVNLSDVAAMGGDPRAVVVALVVPADRGGLADAAMAGIIDAAIRFDCPVVGGDTCTGPVLMVGPTVLGTVGPGGVVPRAGARPGDTVFVTGRLGAAAGALRALRTGLPADEDAIERLRRPIPRLVEGRAAAIGGATAMIDVSDGIGIDLTRLCDASGVGVRLDASRVPLAAGAALHDAFGGDDYELCFTAPDPARVAASFAASQCRPPVRLGTITTGERLLVDADGHERPLPTDGWEHGVP